MCSSQPGLSQCIVWAGVGGADFPSVSLVTGRDFSLLGGGALVCTFTRWEGGVEGAALPLTKLYRHKNTAPITTTLSRALRKRERGELSQALSLGPKHLRMARYRPSSARGHLGC